MDFIFESRKDSFSCFISDEWNTLPHLHYHLELIFIIEGMIEITVNKQTNKLNVGDMALIFPNQIHYGNVIEPCRILTFIFSPDFISDIKEPLLCSCLKESCFPLLVLCPLSQHMIETIVNIKETGISDSDDYYRIAAYKGMLLFLVADVLSKREIIEGASYKDYNLCQSALDYIELHFRETLSLDFVAKNIGVSPFTLSRMFSNELNIPFTSYISQRRLDYARELIINSQKSITEIMYEAGFRSERTFYRDFKKYFGQTPQQFRYTDKLSK